MYKDYIGQPQKFEIHDPDAFSSWLKRARAKEKSMNSNKKQGENILSFGGDSVEDKWQIFFEWSDYSLFGEVAGKKVY